MTKDSIVLGGGCFWCLEAIYSQVNGVIEVEPGYAGGDFINPKYEDLHLVEPGYAEVIKINFNSKVISLDQILEIFWHMHDPTTLNRQGADVGPEYRSIVLYQKYQEEPVRRSLEDIAKKVWVNPIVTELKELTSFYPAEEHHKDFYKNNPDSGYCQIVINPKINKFRKEFTKYLT